MISKYNADDRWTRVLDIRDSLFLPITTLNMQQAFPETSVQPSIFYVDLDDLFKQDRDYFAIFSSSISPYGGSLISFYPHDILMILELQCTQKQAQELLSLDLSLEKSIVIVAKIRGVKKLSLTYKAETRDRSDEEVYIEPQPSKVFSLTGELLDFCMVK